MLTASLRSDCWTPAFLEAEGSFQLAPGQEAKQQGWDLVSKISQDTTHAMLGPACLLQSAPSSSLDSDFSWQSEIRRPSWDGMFQKVSQPGMQLQLPLQRLR